MMIFTISLFLVKLLVSSNLVNFAVLLHILHMCNAHWYGMVNVDFKSIVVTGLWFYSSV